MKNINEIQQECIDKLIETEKENGVIKISPRGGKTRIMMQYLKKVNPKSKILWVTPSVQLIKVDIPQEKIKWDNKNNISYSTYASLDKNTQNTIYDYIILDEIQFITENNVRSISKNIKKIHRIIGMTGTIPKDTDKRNLMKNNLKMRLLHKFDIEQAGNAGIIANYYIRVLELEMNKKEELHYKAISKQLKECMMKGNNSTYLALKRKTIISSFKHRLIESLMLKETISDDRAIYFFKDIKTSNLYMPNHSFNSKTNNKAIEAFKNGTNNKLGLVNSGGTGHTFRDVKRVVITQCDANSLGSTTQKIARGLLKNDFITTEIIIMCVMNTQDEKWVNNTLKDFDDKKIIRSEILNN